MSGYLIALEGLDGSGKSTVATQLAATIRAGGREVVVTREPGGTVIGEQIRSVLLGATGDTMRPETEALLFAASRAQHVAELIQPALERGAVVISDRFTDSSLAYQGGGRGLPFDAVNDMQRLATRGLEPDLKLLLDLHPELAMARRRGEQGDANRLDREVVEFYRRVREAYLTLVASDPVRWRVIDASRARETVWRDVSATVVAAGVFGSDSRSLSATGENPS